MSQLIHFLHSATTPSTISGSQLAAATSHPARSAQSSSRRASLRCRLPNTATSRPLSRPYCRDDLPQNTNSLRLLPYSSRQHFGRQPPHRTSTRRTFWVSSVFYTRSHNFQSPLIPPNIRSNCSLVGNVPLRWPYPFPIAITSTHLRHAQHSYTTWSYLLYIRHPFHPLSTTNFTIPTSTPPFLTPRSWPSHRHSQHRSTAPPLRLCLTP
jgi:hypothetical protein